MCHHYGEVLAYQIIFSLNLNKILNFVLPSLFITSTEEMSQVRLLYSYCHYVKKTAPLKTALLKGV